MKKNAKVYLVGAGPGDPDLISFKGIKLLQKADAVVYDYLANSRLLGWAPQAERIYVGKQGGLPSLSQDAINQKMVRLARSGKMVVRLKGGDPTVFGRGGEEAEFLRRHKIAYEFIPGVTSGVAAPIYAGIPVTHRELASEVTFVTAHEDPRKENSSINWSALAQAKGTLVVYMGVKTLPLVTQELLKGGKSPKTPAALIYRGTFPDQKVLEGDLGTIAEKARKARFQAPSIIVIGDVCRLRKKLTWFEEKPLFGKKIIVTRSRKQASVLREKLEELGAHVVECPVIRIEAPTDCKALDQSIRQIGRFDWIVFTSVNGVDGFFERFSYLKQDLRSLGSVKIAAIGPATREALERFQIFPEVTPKEFVAESLLKALKKSTSLRGKKFLLARSKEAREFLSAALRKEGALVQEVVPYEVKRETASQKLIQETLRGGDVSAVTFTSSQIAENFIQMAGKNGLREKLKKTKIFSIGPITTRKIKSLGLSCDSQAKVYTIPGLVDVVVRKLKVKGKR